MINLHEIESTIELLKRDGTSMREAETLALLYIAREQMQKEEQGEDAKGQSRKAARPPAVPRFQGDASDFLRACEGVEIERVLEVLDEHMEAIRVLYPKEYEKVVRRIAGIGR